MSEGVLDNSSAVHSGTRYGHSSGARKMVLCRMVPKDKDQQLMILWVETASCLRETCQERWGAPPPFLMGFPEAGGSFDPNNHQLLVFLISAPFGAAPFYGYPNSVCIIWGRTSAAALLAGVGRTQRQSTTDHSQSARAVGSDSLELVRSPSTAQ